MNKSPRHRDIPICSTCLNSAVSGDHWQVTECLDKMLVLSEALYDRDVVSEENIVKINKIMDNIIRTQNKYLKKECLDLIKEQKSHENIKTSSTFKFITSGERNSVLLNALLSFVKMSSINLELAPVKKLSRLCLVYETVLSTRNLNVVTLPSLSNNLRLLKLTHNKALVNSVGYPSGGKYHTIQRLANKDLPRLMPPSGDFISTDDNMQIKRVVASRDLRENFKFNVKVVNNHAFFQTENDKHNKILQNPYLKPKNWLHDPTAEEVDMFEAVINSYQAEAKKVRMDLLSLWIEEEENSWGDLVHRLNFLRTSKAGNIWPCQLCSNSVQDAPCTKCGFDPSYHYVGKSPYDFCPAGSRNDMEVYIGETGDFNPAGLENCSKLHTHVKNENILQASEGQQVGVSVNDCRIYHDGSLVQEVKKWCVTCHELFNSDVDGEKHINHITELFHADTIFSLGWGHLEVKLHSCFLSIGWDCVLKSIASQVFGHRTQNSLDYVLKCKDFHKTYQFIHCFTEAAMKELISVYVIDEKMTAKRQKRTPQKMTAESFHKWATTTLKSPRAIWLYSISFSFGMMLIVLRAAIRVNNVDIAKGAMYACKALLFACHCPLYRPAILRSGIIEEVLAPPELRDFISKHKFGMRKLSDGKPQEVNYAHQPLDLLNEEVIRNVLLCVDKRKLQKNADSGCMERDGPVFVEAARYLGYYGEGWIHNDKIYDRTKRRHKSFFKAILSIRRHLRLQGFLNDYKNPNLPFYSIDLKMELHPDFHNIKRRGEKIFDRTMQQLKSGVSYSELTKEYVPRTVEEESCVTRRMELSKEKIFEKLLKTAQDEVSKHPDDAFLKSYLKSLKSKTASKYSKKSDLLEALGSLEQYVSDLNIEEDFEKLCGDSDTDEENDALEDDVEI